MSIVAPAIEAELSYRRERIAEDFRRARVPRQDGAGRSSRAFRRRLLPRAA